MPPVWSVSYVFEACEPPVRLRCPELLPAWTCTVPSCTCVVFHQKPGGTWIECFSSTRTSPAVQWLHTSRTVRPYSMAQGTLLMSCGRLDGRRVWGSVGTCILYGQVPSLFTWNYHNRVNQLYSTKNRKFKKNKRLYASMQGVQVPSLVRKQIPQATRHSQTQTHIHTKKFSAPSLTTFQISGDWETL